MTMATQLEQLLYKQVSVYTFEKAGMGPGGKPLFRFLGRLESGLDVDLQYAVVQKSTSSADSWIAFNKEHVDFVQDNQIHLKLGR